MKFLSVFFSCLIALAWISTAKADLTDGLVLYMSLDEGKGDVVNDASDNGMVGEVQGAPEWIDGKFGKAMKFATSTDKVSIPDHDAFHIEDTITQAAWVKLDRLPGAHAVIFGTRSGGGRNIGFGFGMNGSNNIKVWTNDAGGGFLDINDTTTQLEIDTWYYLAYTHNGPDNGLVEIYVDGELTHSQESGNPVGPAGAPNEVTIGTWSGEAWPGAVDEARLWNRILSADEIVESMNAGALDFGTAVQPAGKLAGSWGGIKTLY